MKLGFDRRGKVNRVIVIQDNKPDLRVRPRDTEISDVVDHAKF